MAQVTQTSSPREVTQHYSHLFAARREASLHGIPKAAMILNSLGTIRYCHADAARLFQAEPDNLVGHHVSALIPDLPFNSSTPGYNLAYATFWAHQGAPREFHGVDVHGRAFGLQVALDRLERDEQPQILLGLRVLTERAFFGAELQCAVATGE